MNIITMKQYEAIQAETDFEEKRKLYNNSIIFNNWITKLHYHYRLHIAIIDTANNYKVYSDILHIENLDYELLINNKNLCVLVDDLHKPEYDTSHYII